MKNTFLLVICLLGRLWGVWAQNPEDKFDHYTVDDGLSQSSIFRMHQDREGFMWFGTQAGLNKFNGYSFLSYHYNPNDTTSLSNGYIYGITEDEKGDLWVGTQEGLNRLDRKTDKVQRFFAKPNRLNYIHHNLVYGVLHHKGKILINTPPVLSVLSTDNQQIKHYYNNDLQIEAGAGALERGLPILVDKAENIWLGTAKGLARFDQKEKKFYNYFPSADTTSLLDNFVNMIYEDRQGNIWVGTLQGLCLYLPEKNAFRRFSVNFKDKSVVSMLHDRQGNYWIGTNTGGLNKVFFDKNKTKILYFSTIASNPTNPNSLYNDRIHSLYQDHANIIWVGTGLGIAKMDTKPPKFRLYQKNKSSNSLNMLENLVASMYKVDEDWLWIGNWGKGLNIANRKTGYVKHFSPEMTGKSQIIDGFVHVIFKDSGGNMWIGTRKGIQVFRQDSSFVNLKDFLQMPDLERLKDRVYGIMEDSQGLIWVSTGKGLHCIDRKNKKLESLFHDPQNKNSLSNNLVFTVLERAKNEYWVGTNNGLNLYNAEKKTFQQFFYDSKQKNSLSNNTARSFFLDKAGNLWIGTRSGINFLPKNSTNFKRYGKDEGLIDEYVYEILADKAENIWFSTNKGISCLNPKTAKIWNYGKEDGLQGMEFNGGSAFQAADGELFFGGVTGFNSFRPVSMPVNQYVPKIVITAFSRSSEEWQTKQQIHNDAAIELNHDDYEFEIEFSALDYTNTKKNQYAYKMEGFSKDWVFLGNRNFVAFSKLPPDTYIFRVKGSNNDGIWNEEGASLVIVVRPPWWKTTTAYVIAMTLIISIIATYIRLRERNLVASKIHLEKMVQLRTEEILQQKEELEITLNTVESQKHEIQEKNKDIIASINYAKRIQNAILPLESKIEAVFDDIFILYKPKDIVSGDFFWFSQQGEKIFLAAADCTGHGVSGAFMTLIGNNLLTQIVNESHIFEPAMILEKLDHLLLQTLQQSSGNTQVNDGMDISLLLWDKNAKMVYWSSAKRPLLYFQDKVLHEIKGSKFPIGSSQMGEKHFESHEIHLDLPLTLYLFTDGYADQFGGQEKGKLLIKNFKILLKSVQSETIEEQKRRLDNYFELWKGTEKQTDDVLVIGIRF